MTPRTSLRWRLRDATADAHARLDTRVGDAFDDPERYAAFLRGMRGFLDMAAATDVHGDYGAGRAALSADLCDLGAEPSAAASPRPALATPATALGWRYVVAGSSLGARVLLPRARALGFDAGFGAHYLALQAIAADWRPLLATLDLTPETDADAVVAGACSAFAAADHCMTNAFETLTA